MQILVRKLAGLSAMIALMLFAVPSLAQTGIAPDVRASIASAAAASRDLAARETAIAQGLGNPQLAATMARKARRRADTVLTSTVIALIASDMTRADSVIEAAVAEAPESRDSIMAAVATAFPARGGRRAPGIARPVQPVTFVVPPAPAPLGRAAPPPPEDFEPFEQRQEEIVDPFEQINRAIFSFNTTLDTLVLRPVAVVYGYVLPNVVKASVRNFFDNLNGPVVAVNDLLQFTFADAGVTSARFLINSTVGVAGLFEVAESFGLMPHHADFGQTLHSYGVGQGFYVMMPIFGPSTVRDVLGELVDSLFQPLRYLVSPDIQFAFSVTDGIAKRESLLDALDDLREGSLDFYAALRGAFYQDRATELRKGLVESDEAIDALFEGVD